MCMQMSSLEPEELREKAHKIQTKIKILEMQREDLQEQINESARSREQSFDSKTLLSKLHNLSKLIKTFNEYFVSDLSSWTDKKTPIIGGVGDASDLIHRPLGTMEKVCSPPPSYSFPWDHRLIGGVSFPSSVPFPMSFRVFSRH